MLHESFSYLQARFANIMQGSVLPELVVLKHCFDSKGKEVHVS